MIAFFVKEIYRVLKPGGKLILTTPNKAMTLSRNPWHVREYTNSEMKEILSVSFPIQILKFLGFTETKKL